MRQSSNPKNQSRWEQIETLLGSKLPSLPTDQQMEWLKDTSWVEDYVQQMLTKSLPQSGSKHGGASPKAEVFDTHYYVIIKVKIADEANPIVKVRTDQVKIEGVWGEKNQLIRLPCLVVPRISRASYKDGILQIKMRKKKVNKTYREVPVRFL